MSARRRLTASARVALAVMLVLLAGVAALSTLAYLTARSRLAADLDATLLRETEAYAAAVGPGTQADERSLVEVSRAYLEARSESGGVRPILVLRFLDGKVLSNSEVLIESAEGNEALRDPAGASAGYADVKLEGRAYRTVTTPVSDTAGRRVAVFQAAIPADTAERVARQLALSLLAAGLLVVAFGALLSAWVARGALAPLREVASTAERVTQQRLAERVAFEGPADEIGTVASSLNSMLDRLEAAFGDQRHFIADASHELRTPLTILRGNLDVMGLPDVSDDVRAEAIAAIDRETERMRRIVDDLLVLAGLESGDRRHPAQAIAAGTLLRETASRIRALGTHEVEAACPDGELWVLGEPDRLEQALLNLVGNAQAHSPEGGTIEVACHGGSLPDGRPAVLMEVADSGPGIRPEDLERIFDRFYRAQGPRSGSGGGSGLGLAITQRLVELHGGVVSASNRPDGGAVFTIALPRIDPPKE